MLILQTLLQNLERRRIELQSLVRRDPRLNTMSLPSILKFFLLSLFQFRHSVIAVRLIALFYSNSLI